MASLTMLIELKVKNFAIINNLHIHFKEGFNVISGETGSGKSIILKSLGLLMGQKADSNSVKHGHDAAFIEGVFDLTERPDILDNLKATDINAEEALLIVRRTINSNGRSRIYLNDNISTLAKLKEVVTPILEVTTETAPLIEMTGQHENRNLQSKNYQLDLLDHYANCWDLRTAVSEVYTEIKDLQSQIDELKESEKTREQRLDFLKYQQNEIGNLDMKPGDEEVLEQSIKKIKSSVQIESFISQCEDSLYNSNTSALSELHSLLQQAEGFKAIDPDLYKLSSSLRDAKSLIEDFVFEVRQYNKNNVQNSNQLDSLENKLSRLRKLQKKFGSSLEEIFQEQEKISSEINLLENSDENLNQLQLQKEKALTSYNQYATKLHKIRESSAKLLSKGVQEELISLNMKGVLFDIGINKSDDNTSKGFSHIEFTLKSSKKDKAKEIGKTASGGELSRILLAVKSIVGKGQFPRTYLFDEVDAGVSGLTAEKVGKKLHTISNGQQVICITHLPQVAQFADTHFLIDKSVSENEPVVSVTELNKDSRVKEIARLISGKEITETSLKHAESMLN